MGDRQKKRRKRGKIHGVRGNKYGWESWEGMEKKRGKEKERGKKMDYLKWKKIGKL